MSNDFVSKYFYNTVIKDYGNGLYSACISNQRHLRPDFDQSEISEILSSDFSDFALEAEKRFEYRQQLAADREELFRNDPIYAALNPIVDTSDILGRHRGDVITRARTKLFDILMLNDFQWFVTVTFSEEDLRNDPELITVKLQSWLSNCVSRYNLKYALVPELHKSGGVHCHMLCNADFTFTDSGTRLVVGYEKPLKLLTIRKKRIPENMIKCTVYNIKEWKYGFSTAIRTYGDKILCNYYIAKYVTKGSDKIFGKYYWSSKNIIRQAPLRYEYDYFGSFSEIFSPSYGPDELPGIKFKYITNVFFKDKEGQRYEKERYARTSGDRSEAEYDRDLPDNVRT